MAHEEDETVYLEEHNAVNQDDEDVRFGDPELMERPLAEESLSWTWTSEPRRWDLRHRRLQFVGTQLDSWLGYQRRS
jgi:hypothetical protein